MPETKPRPGRAPDINNLLHAAPLATFLLKKIEQSDERVKHVSNLNILLCKVRFTDLNNRTFLNITPLQYAVWSRNERMIQALKNAAIKNPWVSQALEMQEKEMEQGVVFEMDDRTYREHLFDDEIILRPARAYLENLKECKRIRHTNPVDYAKLQKLDQLGNKLYEEAEQALQFLPLHFQQNMDTRNSFAQFMVKQEPCRSIPGLLEIATAEEMLEVLRDFLNPIQTEAPIAISSL